MFVKVRENFSLPDSVSGNGKINSIPAGKVPTIRWPNGRWCLEINLYVIDLVQNSKSTMEQGGTVSTYATQLMHLMRYCYKHNIELVDFADSDFIEFIHTLTDETDYRQGSGQVRSNTTTIQIGRTCLSFFEFCGELIGLTDFVGPTGQIRAKRVQSRGHQGYQVYWQHRSFPKRSSIVTRGPIPKDAIASLKKAATVNSSYFRMKRDLVMITLLEVTGCRLAELARITVKSIKAALAMNVPMLSVPTVKRGGNRLEFRSIPVQRHALEFVDEYLEKNRRLIIKNTCGRPCDDGYLLISERTGKRLSPGALGNNIRKLKLLAGIPGQAHAHMFRHRYATMVFVQMIERHEFETSDDFSKALLDTYSLRQQLMQWTGHKSIHSLERYIHLAFDEVRNSRQLLSKHVYVPTVE